MCVLNTARNPDSWFANADKVIQKLLCWTAGKKQCVCVCESVCVFLFYFFYSFDFLKTVILWVLLHIQRFLKQTKKKIGKKICKMLKSTGICEVDLLSFDLPFARV